MPEFIDTIDQLYAVPVGTVLHSKAGMIAARFDTLTGRVFGAEQPVPWRDVDLPAVVLLRPNQLEPQWEPTPSPEVDTFEELLDLPPGSAIRTKFMHPDGHRVYEKFPDGRWKATGSGRATSIDRLEPMLPARLIWHPNFSESVSQAWDAALLREHPDAVATRDGRPL